MQTTLFTALESATLIMGNGSEVTSFHFVDEENSIYQLDCGNEIIGNVSEQDIEIDSDGNAAVRLLPEQDIEIESGGNAVVRLNESGKLINMEFRVSRPMCADDLMPVEATESEQPEGQVYDNSSLEIRNKANSFAMGDPPSHAHNPGVDTAHDPDCDCGGHGYFVGDFVSYGIGATPLYYKAPPGRVFLNYCGGCDAISDEEIVTLYGTPRDTAYEIDKMGVIVVYPRP